MSNFMQYKIQAPSDVHGAIDLPASKSISNRALILKAMSLSTTPLTNLSDCDDTQVMLNAFNFDTSEIDVKAAGTSMRFLTAFFSRLPGEWIITGTKRMKQRPIHILVDALKSIGARIDYLENEGYPPLLIKGTTLEGGEISLSGSVSSQFISALMMIAPEMKKGLTINITEELISKPYIALTIGMMKEFGVCAKWEDNKIIIPHSNYHADSYLVEGDWSGASYWYEILALANKGELILKGLFNNSMQGDSKIAELFLDLGVNTEFTSDGVHLTKSAPRIKKMFYDFSNIPDLAQTFAVTCCMLNIPFLFSGLQTLKIKETDRIEALKNELKKLGFVVQDRDDSILEWDGEKCHPESKPVITTYEDHRMAMAFAPVALCIPNVWISEPHVVSKSYPRFWEHLKSIGFQITEE